MRLRRGKRHTAGDRPDPGAATPGLAVELRGVRRQYGRGAGAVHALAGVDVALPRGTFTAIMGPSGSGKSTFLQCAAGLDRPSAGSVRLGGTEITGMNENELTELRRSRLGFVFQALALDTGTAAEVLGLLRHAVDSAGATVVMVTHDPTAAAWADRVLFLADGSFAGGLERGSAEQIAERMRVLTARTAGAGAMSGVAA